MALALRAALVIAIDPSAWLVALVVAHGCARATAVLLMALLPDARNTDTRCASPWHAMVAVSIAAFIATGLDRLNSLPALGAALGAAALVGALFWRKLRGITGDGLGACAIVTELLVLVVYAVT